MIKEIRTTQEGTVEVTCEFVFKCDLEDWKKHERRILQSIEGVRPTVILHKGKRKFAHRVFVDCPDSLVVDHCNRDMWDNRKRNLRICTKEINELNKGKNLHKRFKGVYKYHGKWRARAPLKQWEGVFNTEVEAAKAYDKWIKENLLDINPHAYLNFPDER